MNTTEQLDVMDAESKPAQWFSQTLTRRGYPTKATKADVRDSLWRNHLHKMIAGTSKSGQTLTYGELFGVAFGEDFYQRKGST